MKEKEVRGRKGGEGVVRKVERREDEEERRGRVEEERE